MVAKSDRVAVLGAGLQGACAAMALAELGVHVDLYERNADLLQEASANNEGKIHLGYVYAKDRSLATARLMVEGALTFQTLLERWLGQDLSRLPVSSLFTYAIHRDSLLSVEDCAAHFRMTAEFAATLSNGRTFRYFGRNPVKPPSQIAKEIASLSYNPETIVAAFQTEEIAIDPEALAALVRLRLSDDPKISCLNGRKVVSVEQNGRWLKVRSERDGEEDAEDYDVVINTLWSNRLAIDKTIGINPHRSWMHRFKYYARLPCADALPSTTIVLGAFGDVVNYGNRTLLLSWYPSGLSARTAALMPPDMPLLLSGAEAHQMASDIRNGIASILPSAQTLDMERATVKGGWIFAWGENDITDPASALHQRADVGIQQHGRYITVDTGKLTTAPLFASRLAALLDS
jgi:glycine/D-amino acid oxidase-like deaminating enzyme